MMEYCCYIRCDMIGMVFLQVCRQISYIGSPPRGQRSIRRSSNGGPMEEPPRSFNTKAEQRACFSAGSVVQHRLLQFINHLFSHSASESERLLTVARGQGPYFFFRPRWLVAVPSPVHATEWHIQREWNEANKKNPSLFKYCTLDLVPNSLHF